MTVKRFRIYYATQIATRPFRIKIFCNRDDKLSESYRRYLEAGIVKEFNLQGCPVYFELVGKEKYEAGTPYTSKNTLINPKPKWLSAEESRSEDFLEE